MQIQIWVGNFENEMIFENFFVEIYSENEDEPISHFSKSQNEGWLDHDFIEKGYDKSDLSFKDKFEQYSYSEKWISFVNDELRNRNLDNTNAIVLVSSDGELPQITFPNSYYDKRIKLEYLGEVKL